MKQSNFFSVFKPLRAASTLLTLFLQNGKCWFGSLILTCCAMIGSGQLVLGQENPCYIPNLPNHLQNVTFSSSATSRIMSNEPYVVRLYIHIVRKHDGTDGRTIEDAYTAFKKLQDAYYPNGIYFKLQCLDLLNVPEPEEYRLWSNQGTFTKFRDYIVQNSIVQTDGMNMFLVPNNATHGNNPGFNNFMGGYAYNIPNNYFWIAGIIESNSVDVVTSNVSVHELGHCLGLFHTFHGSCGEPATEPPYLACEELVQQSGTCATTNCTTSSNSTCNCCTCGDYVCDTYATPVINTKQDISPSCTIPDFKTCPSTDVEGNTYNPQLNNFMNYTHTDCQNSFTSGQVSRMRSTLEATTAFNGILFSTLLANINTDGYTLANYTLPTGSTLWNTPRHIIGKITVPNGATLTISNTTVAFEGTAAGITIEKGGKLIIDNATLRNNSCAATPWQGITVNGNGFIPHPANYLTTNSPDHGIVVVKNGSVIENAQYGIYTSELNTSALGYAEYTGGGIIDVQSSTLRNNLVGIHIGHFYGCQPFPLNAPPPNAQQSKVLNNTFINTAPYLGNSTLAYTHLYLNRSEAVRVDGNTFQTQANTGFTTQTRGTGVVATNTSTTIGSNTLALSNTFINLYKGVDVYNTLTAVSVTNVVRNQFLETDKAITLNSVPFATIENNIIDVKTGTATNDTYGILTTASFGFDILSNFFNSNAPDGNLYTKGIVVQQSYYTNTQQNQAIARDNQFAGKFAASTQIEGDCRNLQTQCNMYYSGSKYDWYIAPNYPYLNGTPAATLLDAQGICSAPSPNLSFATYWHPTATGTYHIKNNAVAPITINYDIDSNPTTTSGNVIKQSCSDNLGQTVKNTSCGYFVTVPDVCCTNGAICESGIAVAGRIRYLIKQNDKQGIVNFLTCIDQVWAYRLLVATLIDQRQLTEALSTLLRIPDDSPDNIEFKAICNAVIANLLNTNSSGGRTNQAQLQSLRTMAQTRQSANTLLTESYLAALQGNSYVRTSAPIEADKTESNDTNTNTTHLFSIVPNPAQQYINLIWHNIALLPANTPCYIYGLDGTLVKTVMVDGTTLIDVSQLRAGIYYCKLLGVQQVEKLIIVK